MQEKIQRPLDTFKRNIPYPAADFEHMFSVRETTGSHAWKLIRLPLGKNLKQMLQEITDVISLLDISTYVCLLTHT